MHKGLIAIGVALFCAVCAPVAAQSSNYDEIITRIEAEGYAITDVRRSWLGRVVITALGQTDLREVVLNRTSGEVLRDQRFSKELRHEEDQPAPAEQSPPDKSKGDKGVGGQPDNPSGHNKGDD